MTNLTSACGTHRGFRQHRVLEERPCEPCLFAHLDVMSAVRIQRPVQYAAALAGREPAEALTCSDRALLVLTKWRAGWTDTEIASHTRMTTYTTARIRAELGLLPNQPSATSTRGVA